MGLGTYEGLPRIRAFWEGWLGTFEQYESEPEQILDLAVRDGQVVRLSSHLDRDQALKAVGLEE